MPGGYQLNVEYQDFLKFLASSVYPGADNYYCSTVIMTYVISGYSVANIVSV